MRLKISLSDLVPGTW